MRLAIGIVLFCVCGPLWADSGSARTNALESELNRVRQEQQAVYQQFQILQALQRNEGLEADPTSALYAPDGGIPNYDDAVRAKQERQERLKYYSEEMRRLSERHQSLDARAGSLIDAMRSAEPPPAARR